MAYAFVRLVALYFSTLERFWYKRDIILTTIGFLSSCLVYGLLYFFESYEGSLTDIIIQWLNDMLGIVVHDYASLNSLPFFLYLVSFRVCLFLFLLCFFYFGLVIFLMPFAYLSMVYAIRRVAGINCAYSWSAFFACYSYTYIFLIRRGAWDLLYLTVCLLFSFVPYIGIFLSLISLFIACHLMGGAYIVIFDAIYKQKKVDAQRHQWTVGFMLFFSMLCPVIGWALIPMWHAASLSRMQFGSSLLEQQIA